MLYDVQYSCVCNKGNYRENNEDNFICDGRYKSNEVNDIDYPLFGSFAAEQGKTLGVFDGMGGAIGGEIASVIAARTFQDISENSKTSEDIYGVCIQANDRICQHQKGAGIYAMGTTAAVLQFTKDNILLCNIGDSRIYRYRDQMLRQLSEDHIMHNTYTTKPPLSQNLGIPKEVLRIEPQVEVLDYQDGDIYMICSDGLTDMVPEVRIEKLIGTSLVESCSQILLKEALKNGGRDNVTVIVCEIRKRDRFTVVKDKISTVCLKVFEQISMSISRFCNYVIR